MKELIIDNKITGVLHPARAAQHRGVLIISHGFRGSLDGGGRAISLAEAAAENFAVLRFAFTPLGTLSRQVAELESVLSYARQTISENVVLLGRSMGGCASLLAAAKTTGILGIIFWSMPLDLKEVFTIALGKENMAKLRAGQAVRLDDEWGQGALTPDFYTDLVRHDLSAALISLPALPVLFIHGELDELVPVKQAEKAFSLAKQPKKICVIRGGDHRFINGFELSRQAVRDWLKTTFGGRRFV